jgi:glycosyltransferase involved in cell wall biosynthesis
MRINKIKHNIVFVVQLPIPLKAAPAQRIYTFYRHMVKRGFNVFIIGGISLGEIISSKLGISMVKSEKKEKQLKEHYSKYPGVNVPLYIIRRIPYINSIVGIILAFYQAIYLVIKKPDVLIVSIPPSDLVLATFLASRITRSIYIVDMRDPSEEVLIHYSSRSRIGRLVAKILRKINYAIYRRADAVIFVTKGMKKMLENHGLHGFLIPNGADLKIFEPVKKKSQDDDDVLCLIFSGGAPDYYDLRPLILTVRFLNNRGFKIKLFLVGTIGKSIENYIRNVGAENYVEYLGFYSPMELASKVFSRCHIGVIPRVNDPIFDYAIPAKFYEYVASGLPVLATCRKESELAKAILNHDVGWICEYGDISCITRTLKKIYLNRSLIEEKRRRALLLRNNIDRNIHAQILVKLVSILLEKRRVLEQRR